MEDSYKNRRTEEANDPAHYKMITIGIVIGMIGVMLRFVADSSVVNIISNILFIIGIYISVKAVLTILK